MEEKADWVAIREEWTSAVQQLIQQITDWLKDKPDWIVRTQTREICEEGLGAYHIPDATIDTPQGRLLLEVKARGVPEAAGRMELAAWPTLHRVHLLHRVGQAEWTIYTDSGISLRYPWTRETFLNLMEDLLTAS